MKDSNNVLLYLLSSKNLEYFFNLIGSFAETPTGVLPFT